MLCGQTYHYFSLSIMTKILMKHWEGADDQNLIKLNFSLFMGLYHNLILRIYGVIKETSKLQYYFLFLLDVLEVKS